MKVFSIIVTFNALQNNWIYKCLDSLLAPGLQTKIIVVDNASTDETCNVIKDKYQSVILIENSENKGFGAANNQGFEYGIENGADYFFLLNQDAWIEKNCIKYLVEIATKNDDYGVISPLHLNGNGSALDFGFSNYIVPQYCPSLCSDFILGLEEKKIYKAQFINAAAWLLPLKSLEIIGGFSPAFFHYGEDDNYCHRVLFHKMKIGVFPFAKIHHDREDRLQKKASNKQKEWTLKYSNPLSDYDLQNEIKYLKRNLLKNKLMRRKKRVITDLEELTFLETTTPKLKQYKIQSQSEKLYKFLNI